MTSRPARRSSTPGWMAGSTKPARRSVPRGAVRRADDGSRRRQSMPLFYEGNSRANFTIDGSQDWTAAAPRRWWCTSAAPRTTGPGSSTRWSTARSDLCGRPDQSGVEAVEHRAGRAGTNLANVTTFSLGVDGSGAGLVFVDDIRLYRWRRRRSFRPILARPSGGFVHVREQRAGRLGQRFTTVRRSTIRPMLASRAGRARRSTSTGSPTTGTAARSGHEQLEQRDGGDVGELLGHQRFVVRISTSATAARRVYVPVSSRGHERPDAVCDHGGGRVGRVDHRDAGLAADGRLAPRGGGDRQRDDDSGDLCGRRGGRPRGDDDAAAGPGRDDAELAGAVPVRRRRVLCRSLDDFVIYSRALSAGEVRYLAGDR